jgi:hypothetical protein
MKSPEEKLIYFIEANTDYDVLSYDVLGYDGYEMEVINRFGDDDESRRIDVYGLNQYEIVDYLNAL